MDHQAAAGRHARVDLRPRAAEVAEPTGISIRHGAAGDAAALLRLFDDGVAWLVARGQTGQWGAEPFSAKDSRVAQVRRWAASGGLWLADLDGDEEPAGAIVVGDAPGYVPAANRPELYVLVLLTAGRARGLGVGARLIQHAATLARDAGAAQVRVDCWDGVPELPAHYERLGFTRVGSFDVGGWPGAILTMEL